MNLWTLSYTSLYKERFGNFFDNIFLEPLNPPPDQFPGSRDAYASKNRRRNTVDKEHKSSF